MASTPEQIINQALLVAARTRRIADVFEGSEEAAIALEIYGQSRDELLDLKDWSFSRRTVALTLLKGPPPAGGFNFAQPWSNIYPAPGFLFEYAYPEDCLDVRSIYPPPGLMPNLDPFAIRWRVDNDPAPIVSGNPPSAGGTAAKVIYCNVVGALMNYRAQITDPNTFDTAFTAALVTSLGKKFVVAFGSDVNRQREDTGEAVQAAQTGSSLRG